MYFFFFYIKLVVAQFQLFLLRILQFFVLICFFCVPIVVTKFNWFMLTANNLIAVVVDAVADADVDGDGDGDCGCCRHFAPIINVSWPPLCCACIKYIKCHNYYN